MTYWIGATLFGPRYYYEGLFSVTIISAAGIAWLAGWPISRSTPFVRYSGWRKLRPLLVTFIVGVLVGINLVLYLPNRLSRMVDLYDITRSDQAAFLSPAAQSLTPALVIVHTARWMEYGALLELENPELTSPFVFAWTSGLSLTPGLQMIFQTARSIIIIPGGLPGYIKIRCKVLSRLGIRSLGRLRSALRGGRLCLESRPVGGYSAGCIYPQHRLPLAQPVSWLIKTCMYRTVPGRRTIVLWQANQSP